MNPPETRNNVQVANNIALEQFGYHWKILYNQLLLSKVPGLSPFLNSNLKKIEDILELYGLQDP